MSELRSTPLIVDGARGLVASGIGVAAPHVPQANPFFVATAGVYVYGPPAGTAKLHVEICSGGAQGTGSTKFDLGPTAGGSSGGTMGLDLSGTWVETWRVIDVTVPAGGSPAGGGNGGQVTVASDGKGICKVTGGQTLGGVGKCTVTATIGVAAVSKHSGASGATGTAGGKGGAGATIGGGLFASAGGLGGLSGAVGKPGAFGGGGGGAGKTAAGDLAGGNGGGGAVRITAYRADGGVI